MGRCGIFVVAKKPEAGRVKTRMSPPLSLAQAAELSALSLQAVLSVARHAAGRAGAEVLLVVAPDEAAGEREAFGAQPGEELWSQGKGDLGERLLRTSRTAASAGFERILFLGMDSPTLSAAQVQAAVIALDESDAAVGPTDDGGYWTIGFRGASVEEVGRVGEALLIGIDWGSERVFDQTLAAAARSGVRVAQLAGWYDLDRFDDLPRARADLRKLGTSRTPEQSRLLDRLEPVIASHVEPM